MLRKAPINDSVLRKDMVVFDIIYNPLKTKLLQMAEEKGGVVLGGIEMFVRQAALQFELFTRPGSTSGVNEGNCRGLIDVGDIISPN